MKKHRGRYIPETFFLVLLILFVSTLHSQAASFSKKAPEPKIRFSGNNLVISWKKRSDLTGYEVYRCSEKGKNRKLVKTTSARKATIKNLKAGKTYYYQVRGYRRKNNKTKYTKYSKVLKVQVYRKSTLKELLLTALQPVGSTMYVWGGGWNEADTGAGTEARTIGVSRQWKAFFEKQNSGYNYLNTKYQIHNGLDCSGYIGWCIYNIMETKNGKTGYVMLAQQMAQNFAMRGWGTYTSAGKVRDYHAGDIMSTSSGHVWMVVGKCNDGSVVLVHASPPGVQLAGTPTPGGKTESKAVELARKYMKKYYPEWYGKFPNCAKGYSYLTDYSQMSWDVSGNVVMSDPDHYRNKAAGQILKDLFRKSS